MPIQPTYRQALASLLVTLLFMLIGVLLLANPSVYAEPLQQGAIASITPIPTDLAGGSITLLDTLPMDTNGAASEMKVDIDGNPVILLSPYSTATQSVLVRCADPQCVNRTVTQLPILNILDMALQTVPNVGEVPVILYTTEINGGTLQLDRCEDPLCTSRTNLISSPVRFIRSDTTDTHLVVSTVGPRIAYVETFPPDITQVLLKSCIGTACTSDIVDGYPGTRSLSISLGISNDIPVMAYNTVGGIALARCESAVSCLMPSIHEVVSYGPIGYILGNSMSLAINPQGNPVILYVQRNWLSQTPQLWLATCYDPACATVDQRVAEETLLSTYGGGMDLAYGASGDLYIAYNRIDTQEIVPNTEYATAVYLLLRRCNAQACNLRAVTQFRDVYSGMEEFIIRGDRAYLIYQDTVLENNQLSYTINLYVGDQPPVPEPTAGPSPTATSTRTPGYIDLTLTAGATFFTPSVTRTFTPTGRVFPTNPPNWTPSHTPTPSATPTPSRTPTVTPSSPPGAAPQRNRSDISIVALRWMPVANATGYEIRVARNSAFSPTIFADNSLTASQVSINTTPLPNGTYYWRVRARDLNGTWGAWSQVDTFVVAAPPTPSA